MSLDRNLFTLNIVPNERDPAVQDLVLPSGVVHYFKEREAGTSYRINLFDPMSQSMLASATAPHASSKHKTIELHNPTQVVEFKSTGTLVFKWGFTWEEHVFEWKREECYLIRKPDPAVLVAITKDTAGKSRTATVQVLDYNLNRFDIADRKGLEIALLTTLLTIQDMAAANNSPADPVILAPPVQPEAPPTPPPRPAPKTGVNRIAEMHALRYEPNEVTVNEEGSIDDYGEYAEGLLADDAMLFITVRSASPADVSRVLQVVEQVKRLRHKREVTAGALREELHQYVIYDAEPRAPRRIMLDDPPANTYTPPTSLTVHLSKIPMPELSPRPVVPKSQQQPAHPRTFPMPATGRAQPPPPRLSHKSSSSLLLSRPPQPRNQRGYSMAFSAGATPPLPPQPQSTQQTAWRGSLWGRSRK
ncbi:hypothetical protein EDB92DRAFT_1948914 [Lactarius akahatsu]|uniref:Uncharacterized protein n=1 Tax=Lactarius akahatsu TaxID=416441 RepID=A0AAD4LCP5_9AGAM|nr:hypothetical protein EDB92DRAFT_1948914 [Lactarius akahatsu]